MAFWSTLLMPCLLTSAAMNLARKGGCHRRFMVQIIISCLVKKIIPETIQVQCFTGTERIGAVGGRRISRAIIYRLGGGGAAIGGVAVSDSGIYVAGEDTNTDGWVVFQFANGNWTQLGG